jgi:hypothetical protein
MQFAAHAQARFIGVDQRRGVQLAGDRVCRTLQGGAGLGHPCHQRARRNRKTVHVEDQFGGTRIGQHLALRQMHAQCAHVGTVLDRFAHAGRKGTGMPLPASACERQSAMRDHLENDGGHVKHLAAIPYPRVMYRQGRVAAFALRRQWMGHDLVRLLCLPERRSLAPFCPPAFLPDDSRNELVFLAHPSDEGGLLELSLFMPSFASSASMRANRVTMRSSLSVWDSRERSGRLGFGGMPE